MIYTTAHHNWRRIEGLLNCCGVGSSSSSAWICLLSLKFSCSECLLSTCTVSGYFYANLAILKRSPGSDFLFLSAKFSIVAVPDFGLLQNLVLHSFNSLLYVDYRLLKRFAGGYLNPLWWRNNPQHAWISRGLLVFPAQHVSRRLLCIWSRFLCKIALMGGTRVKSLLAVWESVEFGCDLINFRAILLILKRRFFCWRCFSAEKGEKAILRTPTSSNLRLR